MKSLIIGAINFYQKRVSPLTKPNCHFYPTCSEYAKQAVEKYGAFKGIYLATKRILRCHPWQTNQLDPLK